MRMILKAGFDTFTGYGNDAVDMAVTFEKLGVDVVPWPVSLAPGLPRTFTDLLTKNPLGGADAAVMFSPPQGLKPDEFASLGDVAVGWSMWERTPLVREDMLPGGWEDVSTRTHWWGRGPDSRDGRQKDWLDLMAVTCPDNVHAFKELDPHVPYVVVPNGIDPERYEQVDRRGADRPFRFFSIGMLGGRKDPFATLQAWELAQQMDPSFDAELILKTSQPGLHPKLESRYRNVRIINEVWSREQVTEFYGHVDCLVSTSRGEGNNKPAMEFMATGGAVMATAWGGHMNWLHPDSGYALPGFLQPVREGSVVRDFRVDVEATAKTLLHVWRNQTAAHEKGRQAAARIRAEFSWEHVCKRFLFHVNRAL